MILAHFLSATLIVAPAGASPSAGSESAAMEKAKRLKQDADHLYDAGKYQEALPLVQQACKTLEAHQASSAASQPVVGCLNDLAVLHRILGDHAAAERILRRILSSRTVESDADRLAIAQTTTALAVVYLIRSDYENAEPLFQQALSVRSELLGENHLDTASSMSGLASLYMSTSEFELAEPLFLKALSVREELLGVDHELTSTSLSDLGVLYKAQGRYRKSAVLLERALESSEKTSGSMNEGLAASLNNLGTLYMETGNYAKSEEVLLRALAGWERVLGEEHHRVATALMNLGTLYSEAGNYSEAEDCYERALRIQRKALGHDHPSTAMVMVNLGLVYSEQGSHAKARVLYDRAIAVIEEKLGENHRHTLSTLNNIAMTHYHQAEYDVAERILRDVLSRFEGRCGPYCSTARSTPLNNLALVLEKKGEHEEAKDLLAEALLIEESTHGHEHPSYAVSLANLANAHALNGEQEAAIQLLEESLDIFRVTVGRDHDRVAECMNSLGLLHADQGQYGTALRYFRASSDIEEKNIARMSNVDDLREIRHASKYIGSIDRAVALRFQIGPDPSAARFASDIIIHRKAQSADLFLRLHRQRRRQPTRAQSELLGKLEALQSQYSALILRGVGTWRLEDYREQVFSLEREIDGTWARIRQQYPDASTSRLRIDTKSVQSGLPADGLLVEYVLYQSSSSEGSNEVRYAACVISRSEIEWFDLGAASDIDDAIGSFRDAMILHTNDKIPGRALYEAIVEPLELQMHGAGQLFIAPDGELNLVPFGALVDDQSEYLIERYGIRVVTSGRDIILAQMPMPVSEGPVLAVGNPAGSNLPGAEHELVLLGELFDDFVGMTGMDATEARLRSHDPPRLLHLATHGVFGTNPLRHPIDGGAADERGNALLPRDNPMLHSWLRLADAGPTEVDDGKLTAYEISGWDLSGTELVTLSACDTGQGEAHRGEGVLGLRRAFAMAGAHAQVMSLWKVSDAVTAELMYSYYQRLIAGEGRSEAMRQVQLDMLRDPRTRHPKYWAAFVVVGKWGPLSRVGTSGREAHPPPLVGCCTRASIEVPRNGEGMSLVAVLVLIVLALRPRAPRG